MSTTQHFLETNSEAPFCVLPDHYFDYALSKRSDNSDQSYEELSRHRSIESVDLRAEKRLHESFRRAERVGAFA